VLHPTVYSFQELLRGSEVALVLDLHGHSRKYTISVTRFNAFPYGCESPNPVESRVFPLLLDSLSHLFNFPQCCFNISADKLTTARWILYDQFKCNYTYTLEISYGGYDKVDLASNP
jgi:hypothetical protein